MACVEKNLHMFGKLWYCYLWTCALWWASVLCVIAMPDVQNLLHKALAVIFEKTIYFRRKLSASSIQWYYIPVAHSMYICWSYAHLFFPYKLPLPMQRCSTCTALKYLREDHSVGQAVVFPVVTQRHSGERAEPYTLVIFIRGFNCFSNWWKVWLSIAVSLYVYQPVQWRSWTKSLMQQKWQFCYRTNLYWILFHDVFRNLVSFAGCKITQSVFMEYRESTDSLIRLIEILHLRKIWLFICT